MPLIERGVVQAAARLTRDGGTRFAAAIRTTDRTPKHGALRLDLPEGEVRLGFAAKGAGMISPHMATMLCFVTCDAVVAAPDWARLVGAAVARSFNRISVDGQESTNDTVLAFSNGASGVRPGERGLALLGQALDAALLSLAVAIVADGEGATKVVRLAVSGARDEPEAEAVARAIADSPLVKAAFYGEDPNWGRVVQSAGQALAARGEAAPLRADVDYGDLRLLADGLPARLSASEDGRAQAGHAPQRARPGHRPAPGHGRRHPLLQRPHAPVRHLQRRVHDVSVRDGKAVRLVLDAMPRLQRFHGAVVVVKYGGAAMTSEHLRDGFAADVVLLRLLGMRPVVVHGGGPEISRLMRRLGLEPEFVDGLRVTDAPTMEAVEMALVGKVNKKIVRLINGQGGLAVGLCGADGRLLEAEPEDERAGRGARAELGYVGSVRRVNAEVLELLMPFAIPVIASVGEGPGGEPYNINADLVAGELAAALGAQKVVFLTDVAGVFDDARPEQPWLAEADLAALDALRARGAISGGMLPKLEAVRTALEGGVACAHIMDGRVEHALLRELLTDDPVGTTITR